MSTETLGRVEALHHRSTRLENFLFHRLGLSNCLVCHWQVVRVFEFLMGCHNGPRSGSRLHSDCCNQPGRYQIFKDLVVNGKQEQKVPSPLYLFYIPLTSSNIVLSMMSPCAQSAFIGDELEKR